MLDILRMQHKDILFLEDLSPIMLTLHRGKSLLQLLTFDLWILIIFFLSIEICVFNILLNLPNPLNERESHRVCAMAPVLSLLLSLAFLQMASDWILNTSCIDLWISRLHEALVPGCYLQSSAEQLSRLIVLQPITQPHWASILIYKTGLPYMQSTGSVTWDSVNTQENGECCVNVPIINIKMYFRTCKYPQKFTF